jgi:hypothetical protein
VGDAGNDPEIFLDTDNRVGEPVEPDHVLIEAAHDEERRDQEAREGLFRHVGPPSPGNDRRNDRPEIGGRPDRRSRTIFLKRPST